MNALEVWQRVGVSGGEEEKDTETCFREQQLKFLKQATWSVTPSAYHIGQGSRSVRQPGDISPMKVFKNQQGTSWKEQRTSKGEECGYILPVFESPALASFGDFYISMLHSAQFSHVILALTSVH